MAPTEPQDFQGRKSTILKENSNCLPICACNNSPIVFKLYKSYFCTLIMGYAELESNWYTFSCTFSTKISKIVVLRWKFPFFDWKCKNKLYFTSFDDISSLSGSKLCIFRMHFIFSSFFMQNSLKNDEFTPVMASWEDCCKLVRFSTTTRTRIILNHLAIDSLAEIGLIRSNARLSMLI